LAASKFVRIEARRAARVGAEARLAVRTLHRREAHGVRVGASDQAPAQARAAGQSISDTLQRMRADLVDSADVTAYYASVNAPYLPLSSADPTLIRRGKQLATIGDAAKELQSCNNCHGPGGAGELPAIPYLAGQYEHYIAFQLTMWQRGFRNNSPDAMADIAKRLDTKDIAALAAYYQQVDASVLAATQPTK